MPFRTSERGEKTGLMLLRTSERGERLFLRLSSEEKRLFLRLSSEVKSRVKDSPEINPGLKTVLRLIPVISLSPGLNPGY